MQPLQAIDSDLFLDLVHLAPKPMAVRVQALTLAGTDWHPVDVLR